MAVHCECRLILLATNSHVVICLMLHFTQSHYAIYRHNSGLGAVQIFLGSWPNIVQGDRISLLSVCFCHPLPTHPQMHPDSYQKLALYIYTSSLTMFLSVLPLCMCTCSMAERFTDSGNLAYKLSQSDTDALFPSSITVLPPDLAHLLELESHRQRPADADVYVVMSGFRCTAVWLSSAVFFATFSLESNLLEHLDCSPNPMQWHKDLVCSKWDRNVILLGLLTCARNNTDWYRCFCSLNQN